MSEAVISTTTPKLIYILFLANIIVPFLGLIGVVMAYVNKQDGPDWLQTHYQFQIRTFWIGLLYFSVGALLTLVLVGWLVILLALVWLIVRCAKGMKYLDQQQAHPNPTGWMLS